jgi:lipoprotein Spr
MKKEILSALTLCALFTGCNDVLIPDVPVAQKVVVEETVIDAASNAINMQDALMSFYEEWKGTKYSTKGNSKKGISPTHYVQRLFKEKFDLDISNNARKQLKLGDKIKKSELQMGDLVFFKKSRNRMHVGVYMNNGDFMHASVKGVKFTKLNKAYYKNTYYTARRVF